MTGREYVLSVHQLLKECDLVYHNAAVNAGLSDCAFWILYVLQDTEHLYTQSEIGDNASIPRQTVNSALKKLEKDGYLTLQHTDGKTGKYIHLTEKGVEFSSIYLKPVLDAEAKVCASFAEEEKELLINTFRSFVEKLNQEMEGT